MGAQQGGRRPFCVFLHVRGRREKGREEEGREGAVLGCFVKVQGWPKLWREVKKGRKYSAPWPKAK